MDWGEIDDWDVDKKAEKLNTSLFGKPVKGQKCVVKADTTLNGSLDKSSFGGDSDDDEKFSKKAKKKLKERKRKENKRSKELGSNEKDSGVIADGDLNEKQSKDNIGETDKIPTDKKQKRMNKKDIDMVDKTPNKKARSVDKGQEITKRKRNRKRKHSSEVNGENENKGGKAQTKVKEEDKTDKGNTENDGETVKKKRKRHKKKKPNSKKNKYKHFGLKSRTASLNVSKNDSDVDNDKNVIENNSPISENQMQSSRDIIIYDVSDKTQIKKKKRKHLETEVELPAKKIRLSESVENNVTGNIIKKKRRKEAISLSSSINTAEEFNMKEDNPKNRVTLRKSEMKTENDKNSKSSIGNKINEKIKTLALRENNEMVTCSNENDIEMKSKKKKEKKKEKKDSIKDANENSFKTAVSPFFATGQGNELQQKVTDKLASARFRFINEQLYTIKGGEAFRMFQQDKTLMEAYNTGFQGQVKQWSVNPLDVIIKQIGTKASNLVVADFGCGEARLSASVKQKVHSFDLYPLNKRITVCDMAKVPLSSGSVDIAVFCLSLMGTNLSDYLVEANRVLKEGGLLKIAEVVSRFTNVNHFIKAVTQIGFKPLNSRELSTMFYLMDFKKVKSVEKLSKNVAPISLKPCVYKKR